VTDPKPVTLISVLNIDTMTEPVTVMSLFIHVCNVDTSTEAVQPSTAANLDTVTESIPPMFIVKLHTMSDMNRVEQCDIMDCNEEVFIACLSCQIFRCYDHKYTDNLEVKIDHDAE